MNSLRFPFSQMGIHQTPQLCKTQLSSFPLSSNSTINITCGLRNGPKKSLWRSRVLSTEAIQAVQCLKLAKSPARMEEVFSSRISRLLKADLCQVFDFLRREAWYEPHLSLFSDMICMLGKQKLIGTVEELFSILLKEGLTPDTRAYTELIGAYLRVNKVEKAVETYEWMKASGCVPDKLTLTILIRNLESMGEEELAATIKGDSAKYLDSPKRFLTEVQRKYPLEAKKTSEALEFVDFQRGRPSTLFEDFLHANLMLQGLDRTEQKAEDCSTEEEQKIAYTI
ncbi:hypothetical protein RJ640_013425 [Escallonia rubra]|uniref:Pentatricopeptide repeat-containing protein n=1 Tax=Escallonia rubra TaxID=112253 RepID=A0AA88U4Y0_9ASTE|nr:hypothetical protein RJ640_013425 [Escallonia rubra]